MLVLGTTHSIRVVTTPATDVDVYASFVDKTGTTMAADIQVTSITTAATTPIVSAPSTGVRGVTSLVIRNRDTTDVVITVELYDGVTASELLKEVLYQGEEVSYTDQTGWYRTRPLGVTRQVFAVGGSGTYTTPVGVTAIVVECQGGGGGGGGATAVPGNCVGGGGGAGGYSCSLIASPASSYAYTVGAAGTAGASAGGTGGAGGASTFNSTTVVANGGSGGSYGTTVYSNTEVGVAGGAAGALGTGDITSRGEAGNPAFMTRSGAGGNSRFGGAGNARSATSGSGNAGTVGSGGSGGASLNPVGGAAGGAGGIGLIIVTEYR